MEKQIRSSQQAQLQLLILDSDFKNLKGARKTVICYVNILQLCYKEKKKDDHKQVWSQY